MVFLFLPLSLMAGEELLSLFNDLALIKEIDERQRDSLPLFYNGSMVGGYFNMPSSRTTREGIAAFGTMHLPPYEAYAINFQYFDRLELSLNYRIYSGVLDSTFGHLGFGDEAERTGNIKFILNLPDDGFSGFPTFAVGLEDFLGTRKFYSQYVVGTKSWANKNLEVTLGWGRKRIKGFFGGIAWTPWRKENLPLLSNLSFMLEYDAYNYQNHPHEHPKGRKVDSRINIGLGYLFRETLQLTFNSLRGREFCAMGSLRYPFGDSKGFIPKVRNPAFYETPADQEPLGILRPAKEFTHELGHLLGDQGLDLYQVYLTAEGDLWIKVINNMYREEPIIRKRLQRVFAAILPSNISKVTVTIEANGILCQSYTFRREDLARYYCGEVAEFEMATLSPMKNSTGYPFNGTSLFKRKKAVWLFTFRPRIQTFFGSSTGKLKYNLSLIATPCGYLLDEIFYELQVGYAIKSSILHLNDTDFLNPSQLPNVRTDTIKYYQTYSLSLEKGYLQKSWNRGRWFYRLATGYFEPAYGGVAAEILYYPVGYNWAIGVEEATVWKRHYHGFRFSRKIRRLHGHIPFYVPFLGIQAFLSLHYTWRDFDFLIKGGQFLAKDRGVRFQVSRLFSSGLIASLWYTLTDGKDHVNGKIYYDKGFAFSLPIDFFLPRSNRAYIGYGMSAWLRDVGAEASTGTTLYPTIQLERIQLKQKRR